jgi:hypothetical protein
MKIKKNDRGLGLIAAYTECWYLCWLIDFQIFRLKSMEQGAWAGAAVFAFVTC